eukprot:198961-Hanusia_phi.AAC.1
MLKALEEKEVVASGTRESASALEQKISEVETSMARLVTREECQELVQGAKAEMAENLSHTSSATKEECMSEISKVEERRSRGLDELKAEIEKELQELQAKLEGGWDEKLKGVEQSNEGKFAKMVEDRLKPTADALPPLKNTLYQVQEAIEELREWSKAVEDDKNQPNVAVDASQLQSLRDLYASHEKRVSPHPVSYTHLRAHET